MKIKDDEKIFAFILMPFTEDFDDIYKFGIKEAANNLGVLAERVDEQIFKESILERIYRQIDVADIIIADMSGKNPNVFYEVGYAHAKDKICILLTADVDDIPFDLKHRRHIVYGSSIQYLRDEITKELKWAVDEIQNIKRSQIKVSIKSIDGHLEKSKYAATATVSFIIDLSNDSNKPSSEIEAIYFYTGLNWQLYQGSNECASTSSDIADYNFRHFLQPPIKILHKNTWAQLKFHAKRTMGLAFSGEELKDSYPIHGHGTLRLVTNTGNYDYKVDIDLTVSDLEPF